MQQPETASGRTVGSGRSDDAEQGSNEPSFKQRLRSATKKVVSVAASPGHSFERRSFGGAFSFSPRRVSARNTIASSERNVAIARSIEEAWQEKSLKPLKPHFNQFLTLPKQPTHTPVP